MERWRVADLMKLHDAVSRPGLNSFIVRRTLQRLSRGEIEPLEAARIIAKACGRKIAVPASSHGFSHECINGLNL
jgi:hypothetical protein